MLAILAVALPLLVTTSLRMSAQAAPKDEQSLVADLRHAAEQSDQLVEQYNATKAALDRTRLRLRQLGSVIDAKNSELARLRQLVGAQASAAYIGGPASTLDVVLGSVSPADVVERMKALDFLAQQHTGSITQIRATQTALTANVASLEATRRSQAADLRDLAARRTKLEQAEAHIKALVAKLHAAQLAAQLAAQPAPARPAAAGATSFGTKPASVPAPRSAPASGRAGIAVAFAYAQLGKPYQWGAAGPGSYDCSGLTMAAWAAAGVSLSHLVATQYSEVQRISFSQIQPGDLVFANGLGHVAIYVGGGMTIAATHTGDFVSLQPYNTNSIVGFGRP